MGQNNSAGSKRKKVSTNNSSQANDNTQHQHHQQQQVNVQVGGNTLTGSAATMSLKQQQQSANGYHQDVPQILISPTSNNNINGLSMEGYNNSATEKRNSEEVLLKQKVNEWTVSDVTKLFLFKSNEFTLQDDHKKDIVQVCVEMIKEQSIDGTYFKLFDENDNEYTFDQFIEDTELSYHEKHDEKVDSILLLFFDYIKSVLTLQQENIFEDDNEEDDEEEDENSDSTDKNQEVSVGDYVEDFTDKVERSKLDKSPRIQDCDPIQNASSSSFVVQTDSSIIHQYSTSITSTFRKYQSKLELWNLDDEHYERFQLEINRVVEKLKIQNERRAEKVEPIELTWKAQNMAIPSRLKYVYFKPLLFSNSNNSTNNNNNNNTNSNTNSNNVISNGNQFKEYVKIKFVITDLTFNRYLKRLSSGLIKSKFGLVHVALLIGNVYLEWNDSSLVKIREPGSMNPLFVLDVATIRSDNLDQMFLQIAQVVSKWNIYHLYNTRSCNCQHFVTDLLQTLHLESIFDKKINQNTCVKQFFKKVKMGKLNKLSLELSKEMQNLIKENEKEFFEKVFKRTRSARDGGFFSNGKIPTEITFKSHSMLDQFCHFMKKHAKNPNIRLEMQEGDYYNILKAFDRAFWLRKMALDKLNDNTAQHQEILKLSEPLDKEHGGCFFSEYDEENDKYKNSLIDANDFIIHFTEEPPKKFEIL
ncbi:predicted protein [Naegleria gruberi]|uniref:Predicted protein n=1 Tax=Naegleria gruberi TaxID=5762 RepID=D2W2L8_NAEGR|nr:uncharacterized protein NAEGRDRAFT_54218 [Naegleria gruberi]EFC36671.1 predicted protein [Naegleria gruberi]|eukprot:XP_002669415.1 predicted protein [Naegleria gruberi strain NEG-M]